ncbi:hypothetical protein BATDEDRAFT_21869 [Batrachochytrium dendrobatidis JAM81]|uniref:PPPDE domain-containing protein n=1 Tax=Batrachochytrium dendrobatidis (strain JAM81 / FGSC 10211) TaxID=684364 RepID=F4NVN4_BATDJ|nr:uncharacterized protein BATDEDRAFT_21869 [Batrachochytrium dendrobatidis JAM81]EGF84116.1 hypothetical protein BATDEDRAFT_21869 [Batrachochytrium dendrobatidis JAM81]|eukprot:XP_006675403.1 hypothetical protein BATDEDRAFT_21869 [Batrachochytrium dendrobatidis JAM81]
MGNLHHSIRVGPVEQQLDQNRQPVGIKFERQDFKQQWIDEGKVTAKEEIGSTSLPLDAIAAVGESLILHFGDYRRLYRNCQTFADIFVQIVCDVDHKAFSSPSIQNVIATTLLAFPLTTVGGSVMHIKQKNFVKKTKKAISWEDIVDAEINDEINKIELGIVGSKTSCSLIKKHVLNNTFYDSFLSVLILLRDNSFMTNDTFKFFGKSKDNIFIFVHLTDFLLDNVNDEIYQTFN